MDQNNSPDELFEIKPDADTVLVVDEEDIDIKINNETKSTRQEHIAEAEEVSAEADASAQPLTEEEDEPKVCEQDAENEAAEEEGGSTTAEKPEPEAKAEVTESEAKLEVAEPTRVEVTEAEEDDFSAELEEMEQEEEDLQILEEIGDSIVQQVDSELENSIIAISSGHEGMEIDTDSVEGSEEDQDENGKFPARIKRFLANFPWWGYMTVGIVTVLIIFALIFGRSILVKVGSKYAAEKITYQPVEAVSGIEVPDEKDDIAGTKDDLEVIPDDYAVITPDITPTEIPVEDPEAVTEEIRQVYNILIIGEENIGNGGYRGRSDLIMIATINLDQMAVKLTSIMRDSLVAIPGYADNRINAAYAIGGVSLLYDTLKLNLGVDIDNYILVNFSSFENIVDAIGGVDIELTRQEANYLNSTNYISNPEYRNVVEGMNHLNGNQALGYCRIRNVGTAGNEYSDFGRTSRQRTVMNEIYKSASGLNYFGLMSLANKCLPYVTTDADAETIEKYINMVLNIGINTGIENYRIPVSGSFSEVLLRDMLVTQIDLQKNSEALHTFIYGEESTVQ